MSGMSMMLQRALEWSAEHYETLGALLFVLANIWRNYRTRMLHAEHLERERLRHMRFTYEQSNETLRTASTAFASEEPQTLEDLLSHAERDWSLKSSGAGSLREPDDEQQQTVRAIPRPRPVPPPRRPPRRE